MVLNYILVGCPWVLILNHPRDLRRKSSQPGARFSKVPVAFRARNQIFKSKYRSKYCIYHVRCKTDILHVNNNGFTGPLIIGTLQERGPRSPRLLSGKALGTSRSLLSPSVYKIQGVVQSNAQFQNLSLLFHLINLSNVAVFFWN